MLKPETSNITLLKEEKIAIIGLGGMGQIIARLISDYGLSYMEIEKDTQARQTIITNSSVIFVCTPLANVAETINEIKHTGFAGLLVEIASTKDQIINDLKDSSGSFLSLHPMFGPSSFPGNNLNLLYDRSLVCKHHEELSAEILSLFSSFCHITHVPIHEHDKVCSLNQSLVYILLLLYKLTLTDSPNQFATPQSRALEILAHRLLGGNLEMYSDIINLNGNSFAILEQLKSNLDILAYSIKTPKLLNIMQETQRRIPEQKILEDKRLGNRMLAGVFAPLPDDS